MPHGKLKVWDVGAGAALLGLLFTGMWAELDTLGPTAWVVGFGLFALSYVLLRYAGSPNFDVPAFGNTRETNLVSALLLVPVLLVAALSWSDAFPFGGDHDHHIFAIDSAAQFWSTNWMALVGFALVIGAQFTRLRRAWWPFVVFAGMIWASSTARIPDEYFARYPATLYTLATPLHLLARWVNAPSVWPFDRLVNLLAPIAWLFVLRPLLFGRTSRWGWLIAAIFLLGSRESVYYVNSIYLEAWPMVLVLVAFEALLEAQERPWLAPLIAGVACTFKETSALVFLTVGAAASWRWMRSSRAVAAVLGAGTVAVIPFILYSMVRVATGVSRNLEIAPVSEAFTSARLAILRFRVLDQFGWLGLAALALAAAVIAVESYRHRGKARGAALILSFAGAAQLLLYFVDKISLGWPGYARLSLLPMLSLLAPSFLLAGRAAVAVATLLGLAQAPVLGRYLAQSFEPSYTRNFIEDYSNPIYVPFRELLSSKNVNLTPGQTIRWVRDNDMQHPRVVLFAYRDYVARYRWEMLSWDAREDQCRCVPGVALLVSSTVSRNLHARSPFAPFPAELDRIGSGCREAIAATCQCVGVGEPPEAKLCTSF